MTTYEQMIETLADWRETEIEYGNENNASYGYSYAIADMFDKSRDEVIADMKAVLKARKK